MTLFNENPEIGFELLHETSKGGNGLVSEYLDWLGLSDWKVYPNRDTTYYTREQEEEALDRLARRVRRVEEMFGLYPVHLTTREEYDAHQRAYDDSNDHCTSDFCFYCGGRNSTEYPGTAVFYEDRKPVLYNVRRAGK